MTVKRALVCGPLMPEFDREGGSQRIFHLIQLLRQADWAVSYIAMNATGGERYAQLLRQMGVTTYAGMHSRGAGDEYLADVTQLIAHGKFDLALLAFWGVAEGFIPALRNFSPQTKIVVDSIDLHFLRMARHAFLRPTPTSLPGTVGVEFGEEVRRELNVYAAADAVLTVSHKENELLSDFIVARDRIFTIPLMEDLAVSPYPFEKRRGLLFIGNFRHPPNVEAVKFLCEEILPQVPPALLKEHPVYIVGNALSEEIAALARELPASAVRMVGWVPGLLPYLQRVSVSLIPLRYGAGTKTKLIQTLTVGTPAVSTSVGIEGLNLQDEAHVLLADDPASFARAIERLLGDKSLWEKLSEQGRSLITATHGREAVYTGFNRAINAILN